MEVSAKLKGARIAAQKARLVADQIRGESVESALEILQFSKKKAAAILKSYLNQQLRMLNITMGLISMSWQYQRFVLMKALQ